MRNITMLMGFTFIVFASSVNARAAETRFVDYVNPMIGTGAVDGLGWGSPVSAFAEGIARALESAPNLELNNWQLT